MGLFGRDHMTFRECGRSKTSPQLYVHDRPRLTLVPEEVYARCVPEQSHRAYSFVGGSSPLNDRKHTLVMLPTVFSLVLQSSKRFACYQSNHHARKG